MMRQKKEIDRPIRALLFWVYFSQLSIKITINMATMTNSIPSTFIESKLPSRPPIVAPENQYKWLKRVTKNMNQPRSIPFGTSTLELQESYLVQGVLAGQPKQQLNQLSLLQWRKSQTLKSRIKFYFNYSSGDDTGEVLLTTAISLSRTISVATSDSSWSTFFV